MVDRPIIGLCNQILPNYYPITEVVEVDGKNVLIIWVPAGDVRPYKAPTSLSPSKPKNHAYFVRHASVTKKQTTKKSEIL